MNNYQKEQLVNKLRTIQRDLSGTLYSNEDSLKGSYHGKLFSDVQDVLTAVNDTIMTVKQSMDTPKIQAGLYASGKIITTGLQNQINQKIVELRHLIGLFENKQRETIQCRIDNDIEDETIRKTRPRSKILSLAEAENLLNSLETSGVAEKSENPKNPEIPITTVFKCW